MNAGAPTDQPADAGARREAPRGGIRSRVTRSVVAAPDRLVLLLFWLCLVVAATVLVAQLRPLVVVPVAIGVVLATWRLAPQPMEPSRAAVIGAALIVVLAVGWVLVNAAYVSRFVVVSRDPGFLTLEGMWLTGHPDPDIPVGAAGQVDEQVLGARTSAGAFTSRDGVLYAQGAKLLPGLLGLVGWVAGDPGVLAGNLAIGALGLVAVYALGRRLVGPLWGLVPAAALAASMPMTVFSRAAYTEPLTVALAFGGLTMIWSGFETRVWWRHVIGAGMVGATALVRIDGAAAVIGLVAGFGLVAAAALPPRQRRQLRRVLAATSVVAGVLVAVGYLDLRLHSPYYLEEHQGPLTQLALALLATVALALGLAVPAGWDRARAVVLRRRVLLGRVAAGAVAVVAVFLASRPLWLVNHHFAAGTGYADAIEHLQGREGLASDPTRSYDEMSVTWLAWYYGWPVVVLAFAGLAMAVRRAVTIRDPRWFLTAAVIGAPSALYLWRVSITPDQVWAVRRLLPITIPGFLILATVAVAALWATRRSWARAAAGVLAVVTLAFPLTTWHGGLLTTVEHSGRYGQARTICEALPTPRVVFVGASNYPPTLRVMCDAEVVTFTRPPGATRLAEAREVWGGGEIAVVTFNAEAVPWTESAGLRPFLVTPTGYWDRAISHIPDRPVVELSSVFLGVIQPDGTVEALPPAADTQQD